MRRNDLVLGALVAVFALAASACGSPSGPPAPAAVAVPHPDLAALEPRVREQLERGRERLDAALAAADATQALAAAYGETGMLYHAYSLNDAAEACYLNAQRLTPRDARWPYYLAHVQRDASRVDEAIASFARVLELDPQRTGALVNLGRLELDADRTERAEPLFRRALELDPAAVPALVGLAKIASSRGDFAAAAEQLEAALRRAPHATELHYPLGLAYRGLGRLELAQSHLERRGGVGAAMADPWMEQLDALRESWRLQQNRGSSLFKEGLYAEALVEFRAAVEAAPEEAGIHVNIGSTLTMLGDIPGAIAEFREALRLAPTDGLAHFNLGTLFAREGDDPRAIEHYRAALEAAPERLDTRFNLANALRRVGRFDDAAQEYRRVVEADPRNGTARLAEALSLIRLRRFDRAIERLEEGLAAVPDERNLRVALVRLLAATPQDRLRDGARALALGRTLVAEAPTVQHVAALAMAAAETGDFTTAIAMQEQALKAVPAGGSPIRAELEHNLARYRRQEPCRAPWREDDPALSPGALAGTGS